MFKARPKKRPVAPVAASWRRLEKWFTAHLPEVMTTLRPPATARQIKAFEKQLGQVIPDDWRQSLLIHDGQEEASPGAMIGMPFDSLQQIASSLTFFRSLLADVRLRDADPDWDERCVSHPAQAIQRLHVNDAWVPLGNWDGNCWGIDLAPGPTGVVGQIINFGRDEEWKYVLALSFGQFLQDFADELEAGSLTVVRYQINAFGQRVKKSRADEEVYPVCAFGPVKSHANPNCAPSLANYFAPWSKAKLPTTFQEAVATDAEPVLPGIAAKGAAAAQGRAVVEQFIQAMHDFEMKWLKVRPIDQLGYQYVNESMPGAGIGYISKCFGFNARPMPSSAAAEKKLQLRKHVRRAVREKLAIRQRFATERPRDGTLDWDQQVPVQYDPARDRVAAVRQLGQGALIVYIVPVNDVIRRYHLKRVGQDWRIDIKDETVDQLTFKRVTL